jgi:antibiotic biosynthesis monooxygenase (ABM) superfamily enzyme
MSFSPSGISASPPPAEHKPSRWFMALAQWCALNLLVPFIFWTLMPVKERPELSAICLVIAQCLLLVLNVRFAVVNFREKPIPLWLSMTGSVLLQAFTSFWGLLLLFLWYVGEG